MTIAETAEAKITRAGAKTPSQQAKNLAEKPLIERAQQGDKSALEELFRQNYPWILAYLLKRTNGDFHAAEDLAAETVRCMVRSIGQYQWTANGHPISTWLIRIARNALIDQIRADRVRPKVIYSLSQEHDAAGVITTASAETTAIEGRFKHEILSTAIRQLTQLHREMIVLCYWYGYSVPEAAELLGIPLGTAKSRTRDAKKRLRELLPPDFHYD